MLIAGENGKNLRRMAIIELVEILPVTMRD